MMRALGRRRATCGTYATYTLLAFIPTGRGGDLQPMVRSPVAELSSGMRKVVNLCKRATESCDSSGETSSQPRTDGHF